MICDRYESKKVSINVCKCQVCAVNDDGFFSVCSIIFYDTVCECTTHERAEVQVRVAVRAFTIRSSVISEG